ncbi:MAG: hypothetical protein AAGB12_16880, partial [Pseudomonadota bacterium]
MFLFFITMAVIAGDAFLSSVNKAAHLRFDGYHHYISAAVTGLLCIAATLFFVNYPLVWAMNVIVVLLCCDEGVCLGPLKDILIGGFDVDAITKPLFETTSEAKFTENILWFFIVNYVLSRFVYAYIFRICRYQSLSKAAAQLMYLRKRGTYFERVLSECVSSKEKLIVVNCKNKKVYLGLVAEINDLDYHKEFQDFSLYPMMTGYRDDNHVIRYNKNYIEFAESILKKEIVGNYFSEGARWKALLDILEKRKIELNDDGHKIFHEFKQLFLKNSTIDGRKISVDSDFDETEYDDLSVRELLTRISEAARNTVNEAKKYANDIPDKDIINYLENKCIIVGIAISEVATMSICNLELVSFVDIKNQ